MKIKILSMAITTLIAGTMLTSCQSSTEKVEDAQKNFVKANDDLNKANEEYLKDIEDYRKKMAEKVAENDKSLAEFKARVDHEKKAAKADYIKKIVALEQKNSDIKKAMEDYKAEGKEKWEIFKLKFSHDMDELGKGLIELAGIKTVK